MHANMLSRWKAELESEGTIAFPGNGKPGDKQQLVIALGRIGWSLRSIEKATGVRRETAGDDLRAAGVAVRSERGRALAPDSKPASDPTPESRGPAQGADATGSNAAEPAEPKPASDQTPDYGAFAEPRYSPRASSCEPFREFIEQGLSRGRPAKALHDQPVNQLEIDRSLRRLKMSGMAATLETRIVQAQTEDMAYLDFLSLLVQDELTRRQDRLLERRIKRARFRDTGRTLDAFDFTFNPKMDRRRIFEMASGRFVTLHEDALFLGPPGTGKSHLAQAIGLAVIQHGLVRRSTRNWRDPDARVCVATRANPRRPVVPSPSASATPPWRSEWPTLMVTERRGGGPPL